MNILLQPAADSAKKNFELTIRQGVPLVKLSEYLEKDEFKKVKALGTETVQVWGIRPDLKDQPQQAWIGLSEGDLSIFYGNRKFYFTAFIYLKTHNKNLSLDLWGKGKDGRTWEYIYVVKEGQMIDIPFDPKVLEYSDTKVLMNTQLLTGKKNFDLREYLENYIPEFVHIDANEETEEVIEGTKEVFVSKEQLLDEVSSYKDTGPSHTLQTGTVKRRLENKAQKRKIAQIEGYACQVCNWSLEWINNKGQASYRIDIDHIIDKAKGGGEEATNLWALCPNCHVKKTLGVITIDPMARKVFENGEEVTLHHDSHLGW